MLRVFIAVNLVSSSKVILAGWSFCSLSFSKAAILAKFGMNSLSAIHSPRKDPVSVRDTGVLSS